MHIYICNLLLSHRQTYLSYRYNLKVEVLYKLNNIVMSVFFSTTTCLILNLNLKLAWLFLHRMFYKLSYNLCPINVVFHFNWDQAVNDFIYLFFWQQKTIIIDFKTPVPNLGGEKIIDWILDQYFGHFRVILNWTSGFVKNLLSGSNTHSLIYSNQFLFLIISFLVSYFAFFSFFLFFIFVFFKRIFVQFNSVSLSDYFL